MPYEISLTGDYAYLYAEVAGERNAQLEKWGHQNHDDLSAAIPMANGHLTREDVAKYYGVPSALMAKALTEVEFRSGVGSWFSILIEEVSEALEEAVLGDEESLREELVQVAAVALAHLEAIDRRSGRSPITYEENSNGVPPSAATDSGDSGS